MIYAYLAVATVLLLLTSIRGSTLRRRQTRLLLLAAVPPWIGSVLYITDITPIPGLNITPTSMLLTGLIAAIALFRGRLLDVAPIARDILLEKMWEGMIVLDGFQRVVDINPAAESLLGLDAGRISGKSIFRIYPPIEELRPQLESEEERQCELRSQTAEREQTLELKISPFYDGSKRLMGRLVMWNDITKRKMAEKEREKLIGELQEVNVAKDRFFSIISHDLRSPFNTIFSFTRLIKKNIDKFSKKDLAEITHELFQSTERTRVLLENLLEWTKSQAGRLNIEASLLPLANIVASALDTMSLQAEEKNIRLGNQVAGDLYVFADRQITGTILRNLISNAIKFTPSGGSVFISAQNKKNDVWISVKDTGTGLDREEQVMLFRMDHRFSKEGTNKEKGSGFGLILCKELLEKQGGRIWLGNSSDKGSTFMFSLPRSRG
jgi:PAS domain S-box-containing protein